MVNWPRCIYSSVIKPVPIKELDEFHLRSSGTSYDFELIPENNSYKIILKQGPNSSMKVEISKSYYAKIKDLYEIFQKPVVSQEDQQIFHRRLWCMLKRYNNIFDTECHVYQAALPVSVYKVLHSQFNVTVECFASPLNCYFRNFCSLCPDTDSFFGSSGDFFGLNPVEGSFEANPPFSFGILNAMVNHIESLLKIATTNKKALSFIVFMPECRHPIPFAQLRMEASKFKTKQLIMPAHEHKYRSGLEYLEMNDKEKNVLLNCTHGTLVFFLQSPDGNRKWPPSNAKLDQLITSFSE